MTPAIGGHGASGDYDVEACAAKSQSDHPPDATGCARNQCRFPHRTAPEFFRLRSICHPDHINTIDCAIIGTAVSKILESDE
jgi:hypothetical protein